MANTYARLITHVTFSTQNRRPFHKTIPESDLYAYLGGIVNGLEGQSIIVNGHVDHVHLLFHYPPRISISNLIQEVKKRSNEWIRERFQRNDFRWQEGFGAFSVDHHAIDRAIRYIQNQEEHHRRKSFVDEYRESLHDHGISFDERYVVEPDGT